MRQVGEVTAASRYARADRHDATAAEARRDAEFFRVLAENRRAGGAVQLVVAHGGPMVERSRHLLERLPLDEWHEAGELANLVAQAHGYADHYEARTKLFSKARWHERRARGERFRIERVEACQTREYIRACQGCGELEPQEDGTTAQFFTRCEAWGYCVSCKGARCAEARDRFDLAADHWRDVFRREIQHPWKRWSEKFTTLTVPHSGSSAMDLAVLQACNRRYMPDVRDWLTERNLSVRRCGLPLPYFRVAEITGSGGAPGAAFRLTDLPLELVDADAAANEAPPLEFAPGTGHAHLHMWMLSPYLPHYVARILFGRAIGNCGGDKKDKGAQAPYMPVRHRDDVLADSLPIGPNCERCLHASCRLNRWISREASRHIAELCFVEGGVPIQWLPWPVLDIREAGKTVGAELAKYLTKDIGPDGEFVDPFEYGNILEATVGRRLMTASLHFWVVLPPRVCPCCEFTYKRIAIEHRAPAASPGGPRGPPLQYIHKA